MKKSKVAVVGAGLYGINHIRAYQWNNDAELVAVCELSEALRAKIGAEYGVRTYADDADMLNKEELDAVSVATPDCYHATPALAAIKAGKHVLIEKPLATTLTDPAPSLRRSGNIMCAWPAEFAYVLFQGSVYIP